MDPIRSVSVLMPIRNGAAFLDRVMAGLARQELDLPWDFHAADSGSQDDTLAIFERWRHRLPVPLYVHSIEAAEFNHGCTRNLLAAGVESDLLVFLTDDAIPVRPDWLAALVANYDDPRVGAAYSRNVPRPEADLLAKSMSATDPSYGSERLEVRLPDPDTYAAMSAAELRRLYNFTDTASSVRRALWLRHPYPRCRFGEDVLLCRALLEDGWTVVRDERAIVHHSHEYDAEETRRRAAEDAAFNAEWLDRVGVPSPRVAEWLVASQVERDREALPANLQPSEREELLRRARELRRAFFMGSWEGGLSKRRRPRTAVLADARLRVRVVGVAHPLGRLLVPFLEERGHRVGDNEVDVNVVLDSTVPRETLHALDAQAGKTIARVEPALLQRASADPELALALQRLELLIVTEAAALERARSLHFDPDRLVYSPDPRVEGLPEPRGTARERDPLEWLGEIEFRLRQLACLRRNPGPGLLTSLAPALDGHPSGEFERVGPHGVLLRAGAFVSADVRAWAGRRVEWALSLATEPEEPPQGARLVVDGGEPIDLGTVTHAPGQPRGERSLRFELELPREARELRVVASPGRSLRLWRIDAFDRSGRVLGATPGRELWQASGSQTQGFSGDVTVDPRQPDVVTLGPGPARAEYDVSGSGSGWREVALVLARGSQAAPMRVLADGRPVARFESESRGGPVLRARFLLSREPRVLAVENRSSRRGRPSRFGLHVLRLMAAQPKAETAARRAAWALRGLADRPPLLEVGP